MARTQMVWIVNRTTGPLDCMFDGIPEVIPPGYRSEMVPAFDKKGNQVLEKNGDEKFEEKIVGIGGGAFNDKKFAAEYAEVGDPYVHHVEYAAAEAYIRQHPIMGTQDPLSVDARDTDYLLGVVGWGHEIGHVEQSDAIELLDRTLLSDERQSGTTVINVAGKRRDVSKGAIRDRKQKENKRRAALDAGENPNGIHLRV